MQRDHDPRDESHDQRRHIAHRLARDVDRSRGAITPARCDVIGDRPREKSTEEQLIGERTVGEQVRKRSDLYAENHRLPHRRHGWQ